MKKLLLLVLLLNSAIIWAQNSEFRATWVVTWEYISSSRTVAENKAAIIQILENHKKANMNAVIWQVRQSGTAYYQSSYEPWGPYAGGVYPGFDPLAFTIEEAHKRGLEVHAWFNTFMISSNAAGRITALHPEWICTNESGLAMTKYFALSPGIAAVREYTLKVAMEIVNNYDIDGLHLDYIRWNEYDATDMTSKSMDEFPLDGMISEARLSRLKSTKAASTRYLYDTEHPFSAGIPSGYSTWGDWRRAGVTEMVKMLHDSIQLVKPYVRLSTAVLGKYKTGGESGWNGYYVVFQDGAHWFNEGYVDQLTPMHYHWYTPTSFINALTTDWEPEIAQGIAAKRMYTAGPGSYILDEYNAWNNHGPIVNVCRNEPWIDGFQFFSYASWRDYNYWNEAGATFFNYKTRIREILSKTPPSEPALAIAKIDSVHYALTGTPSASEKCWYVIYRSEDASFDSNTDAIVYSTFGNAVFSYTDVYSGLQSFNGKYTYFATAYNRYWNESMPSNPVLTDNVPSLPPVVTASDPAEGETVSVSAAVTFTFSKEMNTATLSAAFQISPAVTKSFAWSTDNKTVTITFPDKMSYGTDYTITLGNSLTDINAKAIDGNADGTPGDAYILHFRTEEPDTKGPVLTSSTIVDQQTWVDVASVISFTFNEVILESSLTASCISLKNSSNENIAFSYSLYRSSDNKGVISVKPDANLIATENYTISIDGTITDVLGNAMGNAVTIHFKTSSYYYTSETVIDDFSVISGWWTPTASGSTVGVNAAESSFSINTKYGLPSLATKNSGKLTYSWDSGAGTYLLREYIDASAAPALVTFDTTLVLQVYLFGDSSNNQFRFAIDESINSLWAESEVSHWKNISWYGWKLVEWKLSDVNSVGSWISTNSKLTGTSFRTDSYQLTKLSNSADTGTIRFDRYRVVKKVRKTTGIDNPEKADEVLITCSPNPSSGSSKIFLVVTKEDKYTVTVYDLTGRMIEILADENLPAGNYDYTFGDKYKPGIYLIEIRSEKLHRSIRFVRR